MNTNDVEEAFVKGLWEIIPQEGNVDTILRAAQNPYEATPCGDYGAIVKHMLDHGISPEIIARFEKLVGYEVASRICYYLEDPEDAKEYVDEPDKLEWTLFFSKDCEPIDRLSGFQERLMATDPTGREMRPE